MTLCGICTVFAYMPPRDKETTNEEDNQSVA